MTENLTHEPTTHEHQVRRSNIATVIAKLDAIIRRATKAGLPIPSYTVSQPYTVKVHHEIWGELDERVSDVRVEVPAPIMREGGWRAVAVLDTDHMPGERNMVFELGKAEGDETPAPAEWFEIPGTRCDECGRAIQRNTLVVIRATDGTELVVGGSCIMTYTGLDPASWLWLYGPGLWAEVSGGLKDDEDDERDPFAMPDSMPTRRYLAAAVVVTESEGFIPTSTNPNTRDMAMRELFETRGRDNAEALAIADQIIEWGSAIEGDSDFTQNLRSALGRTNANRRTLGILAYAPTAYRNHLDKLAAAEAKAQGKASQHQGTVGERLEISGTVERVSTFPNHYSYDGADSAWVTIRDAEGNAWKWKASNARKAPAQGDQITGKGTVASHDEWQGEAQTRVSRLTWKLA